MFKSPTLAPNPQCATRSTQDACDPPTSHESWCAVTNALEQYPDQVAAPTRSLPTTTMPPKTPTLSAVERKRDCADNQTRATMEKGAQPHVKQPPQRVSCPAARCGERAVATGR